MRFKVEKHKTSSCGWLLRAFMYRGNKQVRMNVKKKDWPAGFTEALTYEQAKEVAKTYNAQHALAREEAKKARINERMARRARIESAWLPENIVLEFEKTFFSDLGGRGLANMESRFRVVQQLVADLNTKPSFWEMNPPKIYKWLLNRKFSLDYSQRVITLLNRYGRFYCVSLGFPYGDVPWPTGAWRNRISDAFYDRSPDGFKSLKLEDEDLANLKKILPEASYNWLFVARWFGLRPEETDLLTEPQNPRGRKVWWIEENTLHIDQPKLRAIPKKDRYKHIPVTYPEPPRKLRRLSGLSQATAICAA